MKKRVVVALGGNALGNSLPEQKIAVKSTAKTIIDLVEANCDVVVTHGNGPQIGMINNAMAALTREVEGQPNTPLSVCVAMSQAYIGYDLQNALHEELLNRGIEHLPTMTMVTQVLVDQNDPGFKNPTKPIGHFMTKEEAEYAEKNYDYVVKEDSGRGYRRVVASPAPQEIIEIEAIKGLVGKQLIVACGGGGIPVLQQGSHLKGASAIIEKDYTAAKLAELVGADTLLFLTAYDRLTIGKGTADEKEFDKVSAADLHQYIKEGHFPAKTTFPKVDASIRFVTANSERKAVIANLEKAKEGLAGKTGTTITA